MLLVVVHSGRFCRFNCEIAVPMPIENRSNVLSRLNEKPRAQPIIFATQVQMLIIIYRVCVCVFFSFFYSPVIHSLARLWLTDDILCVTFKGKFVFQVFVVVGSVAIIFIIYMYMCSIHICLYIYYWIHMQWVLFRSQGILFDVFIYFFIIIIVILHERNYI